MDRRAWWATVHRVARVRHSLVTKPPPRVKTERPSANRPSECHSTVYIIRRKHVTLGLIMQNLVTSLVVLWLRFCLPTQRAWV